MAYYLAVKNKDGYRFLDISKEEEFKRMSNFHNNNYSLEEIDNYTAKFPSEVVIKNKLYHQGLIDADEILSDIIILMKNNGNLIPIQGGLVYSDNAKYLSSSSLLNIILSLENDDAFLRKLVNKYSKTNSYSVEHLRVIREYLNTYSEEEISKVDSLIKFYHAEIYSFDKKDQRHKLKYKSLHDLAVFVSSYMQTYGKCSAYIAGMEYERKRLLKELKASLQKPLEYPKKRILRYSKDKEIDGQLSLEDLD